MWYDYILLRPASHDMFYQGDESDRSNLVGDLKWPHAATRGIVMFPMMQQFSLLEIHILWYHTEIISSSSITALPLLLVQCNLSKPLVHLLKFNNEWSGVVY